VVEMSNKLRKTFDVGLILTRLDLKSAYYRNRSNSHPPISKMEEYEARRELREGFRQLSRCVDKPQIILAPELSTPRSFLSELRRHSCSLGAICIIGLDYLLDYNKRTAKNEIVIIIPERWPGRNFNKKTFQMSIFKTHPSPAEQKALRKRKWSFNSDNRLWLFDAGPYGKFGVANCYDFLDVEMHLLYRTKIQHLFVLSHNKDVSSFRHTAESLCRTLYCNVVICNTGYYGGSVCVAPYKDSFRRVIYNSEGNELFSTQIIKLPVKSIDEQQRSVGRNSDLKDLPPGFQYFKKGRI
jgi:predicted amidohydrolase